MENVKQLFAIMVIATSLLSKNLMTRFRKHLVKNLNKLIGMPMNMSKSSKSFSTKISKSHFQKSSKRNLKLKLERILKKISRKSSLKSSKSNLQKYLEKNLKRIRILNNQN